MSFTRCASVLLIGALLLGLPTVRFGMVYEDRRDPQLTMDTTQVLRQMAAQPTRVLTHLSRYVELTTCGVDAACFHGGNVLLHALNTLLVLSIAWLFLPPLGAVVVAVMFAAHPVQTEAVAYISARSDLLAVTGLLLALLAASLGSLPGAVVGVVFACLAKETAIVAWGLVFLWALWTRQTAFAWAWGLLSAAGVLLVAVVAMSKIYAITFTADSVLAGHQLTTIWRLLALIPVPYGLTIDHDWASLMPYGPVTLILSLGLTAWALTEGWWRRSWLAFGWLWTLVALSPRLVVPLFEGLHERHVYAVLIGWAFCAGAWLSNTRIGDVSHG